MLHRYRSPGWRVCGRDSCRERRRLLVKPGQSSLLRVPSLLADDAFPHVLRGAPERLVLDGLASVGAVEIHGGPAVGGLRAVDAGNVLGRRPEVERGLALAHPLRLLPALRLLVLADEGFLLLAHGALLLD